MISLIRWLLLPISLIYQFIVWVRNKMYDYNILKSQHFQIPTIVIGNLAVGGAGKSPMTEYLIAYLKDRYKIATLSRGYGRKTKGFRFVKSNSTALEVGDEPLQFKKKFPSITVAVCENRCNGINILQKENDIILLDDAYQHRQLKAGLYILLFDFNSLFKSLLTLPTGNFRDVFSSTKRADIIVITKSPSSITHKQRNKIESIIRKYSKAPIIFSTIQYNKPIALNTDISKIDALENYDILLFTGIANPNPLITYLSINNKVNNIQFADHHNYTNTDFQNVITNFDRIQSTNKIIITTEKDIQRIDRYIFENYPIYYIPISLCFNSSTDYETLEEVINSYLDK